MTQDRTLVIWEIDKILKHKYSVANTKSKFKVLVRNTYPSPITKVEVPLAKEIIFCKHDFKCHTTIAFESIILVLLKTNVEVFKALLIFSYVVIIIGVLSMSLSLF